MDILVLVSGNLSDWIVGHFRVLGGLGPDTNVEYEMDRWCSVRVSGTDINLILTTNEERYDAGVVAQQVCEALALTNRDDRVKVFQIIRGEDA